MSDKRDNCIILLVEDPTPERVDPELKTAFGADRAVHISLDLLQNAYRLAKNFKDSILILSFEKSVRHPDLTWLDCDDPGFLEAKEKNLDRRIADIFQLAFNTGAKKALLLNPLCPGVQEEWLSRAFDAVNEKTVALGLNQDGSAHLVGLTLNNLKVLDEVSFMSPDTAALISEKAKKNKLSIFSLPETYAVKNEETLRKWMDGKDPSPAILAKETAAATAPQPAPSRPEERRHGRHNHKHPAPPPALPGTEEPPL